MREVIVQRKDKAVYRDGDKLVKIFDENYSKADILNEAINQARVAETGLNIPRIHEVTVIGGKSAIVMDFIEGRTLADLMRDYPEKRGEFLRSFVGLQREVHAKKHFLLTKYVDKLKMKILASNLDASTRYDLAMRLDGMRRHSHVLHGDFTPANVLVTENDTPYILDWSHASQGNATADAAKSYLIFRLAGAEEFAEQYLAEFCLQAGVLREYAMEWLPLIAAAQLKRTSDPALYAQLLQWTYEEI